MSKKKSFFSKDSIANIISEVIDFVSSINGEVNNFVVVDKEELAKHLLENEIINESIYDIVVDYTSEACHAMIQKKGKIRCSNPVKKGGIFCNFHTNHVPDITWEDAKRLEKVQTTSTSTKSSLKGKKG